MKSALDLVIDRLGEMSDEEVIEATNYKSGASACGFQLDGYKFCYTINTNMKLTQHYKQINIEANSQYDTVIEVAYGKDKSSEYLTNKLIKAVA